MKSICFYFQVHQPYRLKTYRFFDIGSHADYFDEYSNRYIMQRVAEKCYLPMNQLLLDLIERYGESFKVSFSISGMALDQFEEYAPEVIESYTKLARTGCVEFISETYSHSLSSLRSPEEFRYQVLKHKNKIKELFGMELKTFRNTELIYSDEIGAMVADMGFNTMLSEGAKHILGWKSPNYLYCNAINPKLKLLLKNFRLSDDIAFRFGTQSWSEWPLTADKFAHWVASTEPDQEVLNLFMDYETFGEHQWEDTGIFEFMRSLPEQIFRNTSFTFNTPSELSSKLQPVGPLHVPVPISWADEERDLTAWLGNELQNEAYHKLYALESKVRECQNPEIQRDWSRLQTSDHFYYMCTKWFSDGDVHKYFNHYGTPYEAFINYMNVLADFILRVDKQLALQLDNQILPENSKPLGEGPEDDFNDKNIGFSDLDQLPDQTIKALLKVVDFKALLPAFDNDHQHVKKKFFNNLSSDKQEKYKQIKPHLEVSAEEIEGIKNHLVNLAAELS